MHQQSFYSFRGPEDSSPLMQPQDYGKLSYQYACYSPVLLGIWQLMQAGHPVIVAIDGRCGSGKTKLASLIQTWFSCHVFHMDDFYLPHPARAQGWEKRPGGNIDFNRLLLECLLPAKAGKPIAYRRFDCRSGCIEAPIDMPPQTLTVVEGTYSQHPLLVEHYDWTIVLTCSKETQTRRLQIREGTFYSAFETQWIPMEERYFQQCKPEQNCSLFLNTDEFIAC